MVATEYRVGCASWLDAALLAEGTFYPAPNMTAEDRLRWYARFFDSVEVNATYYGLPAYHTSQAWVDRTPPGFLGAVARVRDALRERAATGSRDYGESVNYWDRHSRCYARPEARIA